jgi:RNA polymerase sigma-70 factor (ECF subfamily)
LERPTKAEACLEQVILPHLDAAHNLARWLTGNADDAQDVVQEACLRAIRGFEGFRGGNGRSWLLSIVRTTSYTWLKKNRQHEAMTGMAEEIGQVAVETSDPARALIRSVENEQLDRALTSLPAEFREALLLREQEGMSYKEIADICQVPLGTVMSRLARAREHLQRLLLGKTRGGGA